MSTFGAFRTTVMYVPRSPGSLLGDFWSVEHRCTGCGQKVDRAADTLTLNADLIGHVEKCHSRRSGQ